MIHLYIVDAFVIPLNGKNSESDSENDMNMVSLETYFPRYCPESDDGADSNSDDIHSSTLEPSPLTEEEPTMECTGISDTETEEEIEVEDQGRRYVIFQYH